MDPEVQAFLDKWAEKSAAKADVLVALGAAKLADHKAKNALTAQEQEVHEAESARQWAIVEARGIQSGDEGRLYDEAYAIAEAYVDSHPQMFVSFERFVNPDDHDLLVTLTTAMSKDGRVEEAAKLTM